MSFADPRDEVAAFRRAHAERRDVEFAALVPTRFRTARVEDVDGPLGVALSEWGRTRDTPSNLILVGPPGTGKTYAAVGACRARHRLGETVAFRSVVRLLQDLRPPDGDENLDVLVGADVLVLDDLAAEKPSEWTREKLDLIVNERWASASPTVVTANFQLDDLRARLGARVWDRLLDGAAIFTVTGASRRGVTR